MEKSIHLYVSRKHFAPWLMALCMAASAAVRIAVFSSLENVLLWRQILLPALAAVLYGLIALLAGEEQFYKTAVAVWLSGLSYALQLHGMMETHPLLYGMVCTCILFFCVTYSAIAGGQLRWPWLLLPLYLAALAAVWYIGKLLQNDFRFILPELLMVLGMTVLLFGLKVHTDGRYHPTWGDRLDGRRVRSIPALDQVSPYIMVNRNGANNLFSESAEITELERYVRRKRKEGLTGFGMSHVIIAAYVRTVAKYPALNRFIAGQKVYSHGEDITLCMTVKKEMTASSPDTVIKAHFSPWDTAEDVFRKFSAQVEEAKRTPLDSGVDNTAGILTLIPGLVLKFVVWLLRVMDYFGLIPAFLLEVSPFHGSAYFTSMGSLGIKPVYHHLYDFGTIPVFCAFGRKRRATEIVDGEIVQRKYVDLKFNLDERICDGYYYAGVIKHFLRLLAHPEVLDTPPAAVMEDIP